MSRGYHNNLRNNPRGSRHAANRAGTPGTRPDSGRGHIMPGSRAREIHRRREYTHSVGEQRGPQNPVSLVNRLTVDRGGRVGGGQGRARLPSHGAVRNGGRDQVGIQSHARPLSRRIIGGHGVDRGVGRGGAHVPNQNVLASTNSGRNGSSTTHTTQQPSMLVRSQPSQDPPEGNAQEPTFTFDPLFDEAPAPAHTSVEAPARVPQAPVNRANNKKRPARVVKEPVDIFQNAKLRALLGGKKTREPKKGNGMLLRMSHAAKGIQGYELTSSSPVHYNEDGELV